MGIFEHNVTVWSHTKNCLDFYPACYANNTRTSENLGEATVNCIDVKLAAEYTIYTMYN